MSTNNSNDLVLVPYVSPTMNHDPWKDYNDRLTNKINDEILKSEIERWER